MIDCIDGTLDSIVLSVIQNGITTRVNVTPTISTGTATFCFTLDSNDFPNTQSGYDFTVTGYFTVGGGQHTETDIHTNPGQANDIVFSCLPMDPCFITTVRPTDPTGGPVRPNIPIFTDKPTFLNPFTLTPFPGTPTIGTYVQYEGASRTITSTEVWDHKIYIADGVIITVQDALLDLTNVDIIFGECAGIQFIGDAEVRANNSVFRPCDVNETWLGFIFRGSATVSYTHLTLPTTPYV